MATFACLFPETTYDCSTDRLVCRDGACQTALVSAVGEIIFTEIMYNPESPLSETADLWFVTASLRASVSRAREAPY